MKNALVAAAIFASFHFANAQNVASVYIGKQEWMAGNLDVSVYWDGTTIPETRSIKKNGDITMSIRWDATASMTMKAAMLPCMANCITGMR